MSQPSLLGPRHFGRLTSEWVAMAIAAAVGGVLIAITNVSVLVMSAPLLLIALVLISSAPLWLYLAAFASMWPWTVAGVSLVKVITLATIGCWAIGVPLRRQPFVALRSTIDWSIAALFCVAFASILAATPVTERTYELQVYAQALALYVIARSVTQTRARFVQSCLAFIAGAVLAAGLSLWQYAHGGFVVSEGLTRLNEAGIGVNNFASIELAACAMVIGLAVGTPAWRLRLIAGAAVLLLLAAIVESRSRGAFIGLVALAPLAALGFHGRRPWLILGGLLAAVVVVLVLPGPTDWLGLADYRDRMLNLLSVGTVLETSRPYLWRMALEAFTEHPLTGLGIGNFIDPGVWAALALRTATPADVFGPNDAHSFFLGTLADLGLLGTLPLLIAAVICAHGACRALTAARRCPEARCAVYAGVCGLVAYFTAAALLPVQDFPLPYILLGMGANLPAIARGRP